MPERNVVFFRDDDGSVPALEWLREIKKRDQRITAKFHARILELKELGWEMTRPSSDTLRDGIHELRVRFGNVNYRLLYSFHGQTVALLSHGLTKEDAVPSGDIDLAVRRGQVFAEDPEKHTYVRQTGRQGGQEEQSDGQSRNQ